MSTSASPDSSLAFLENYKRLNAKFFPPPAPKSAPARQPVTDVQAEMVEQMRLTISALIDRLDDQAARINTLEEILLKPKGDTPKPNDLLFSDVLDIVADVFGVTVLAIKSQARGVNNSYARFACYWLGRDLLSRTQAEMARMTGGKDHTSVHAGLRRADQLRELNADFRAQVDEARCRLVLLREQRKAAQ